MALQPEQVPRHSGPPAVVLERARPSHRGVLMLSWASTAVVRGIDAIGRRLHVELVGVEHLPAGRALFVANHAFGFWDLGFAVARIEAATGRRVWSLGEHLWWKIPLLRDVASAAGVVDGTPENADALLSSDELVLVVPGGLREALKPRELRYRLLWGQRYGFIRAALRNHAPIVPLACIGADDLFDLVGDPYRRARRLRLGIPLPRPLHYVPIPHLTKMRFVIGEPIAVEGRGDPNDPRTLRSVRREVEGALHELIEQALAERVGFGYASEASIPCTSTQGLRAEKV